MENIRGLRDDEDFRWCVQFNAHALCMLKVSFDRQAKVSSLIIDELTLEPHVKYSQAKKTQLLAY